MDKELVKHAIQLEGIAVKELFIRVNSFGNDTDKLERNYKLGVGHSEFDKDNSEIDVGILVKIGSPDHCLDDEKNSEIDLKVNLLAKFSVDQDRFPIQQIDHWAENNAPLILFPYLREHVYALSIRAGIKPILLPLMEVPVLSPNK